MIRIVRNLTALLAEQANRNHRHIPHAGRDFTVCNNADCRTAAAAITESNAVLLRRKTKR